MRLCHDWLYQRQCKYGNVCRFEHLSTRDLVRLRRQGRLPDDIISQYFDKQARNWVRGREDVMASKPKDVEETPPTPFNKPVRATAQHPTSPNVGA